MTFTARAGLATLKDFAQEESVPSSTGEGRTGSLGSQAPGKNIPYGTLYPRTRCRHYSERSLESVRDAPRT